MNQARTDLETAEDLLQAAIDAGDVSTSVYTLFAAVIARQRDLSNPPTPSEASLARHLRQRAEQVMPSAYGKRPESHADGRNRVSATAVDTQMAEEQTSGDYRS